MNFFSSEKIKLPTWYKPIDPVLQEFLKEYHQTSTKMTRSKYANMFPCVYDTPYMTDLGSCTLLKRTRRSKVKYSTPTTVTFVNFSKYELEITVTSIATTIKGCGVGIMGNNITIDVSKTEPREQTIKLQPILHNENLVERVRDDHRVLNFFRKSSVKSDTNKMNLIIPKCLASSTALIDPYSYTYYLTVKVNDPTNKKYNKPLMYNLAHSSSSDVIFNNENIDQDFNGNIIKHVLNLIEMKKTEIEDNTEELKTLENQKLNYQDKLKKTI